MVEEVWIIALVVVSSLLFVWNINLQKKTQALEEILDDLLYRLYTDRAEQLDDIKR